MLYQKCAYQMKVNFFPAVIGEIDDDNKKNGSFEITNCAAIWAFTPSFYTWSTSGMYCLVLLSTPSRFPFDALLLFIKSFYWIILLMVERNKREEIFNRSVISLWQSVMGKNLLHNYDDLRQKFSTTRLKLCAEESHLIWKLSCYMLCQRAKVDAINYFNIIGSKDMFNKSWKLVPSLHQRNTDAFRGRSWFCKNDSFNQHPLHTSIIMLSLHVYVWNAVVWDASQEALE